MMSIRFLIFCLISGSVMCWNSTGRYMTINEGDLRNRKSKLFSFHTLDEDITVELDFAVPFLKIPIKKSMEMTKGAMANINLGAVLLAGVVSLAAAVVIPGLLSILTSKMISPHFSSGSSSYSPYRTADSSEMWRYLAIFDHALMDINIDTTSCMQRTLCSTIKNSSNNVNTGNGSSIDKIIDGLVGLVSNDWLHRFISHTPFYAAMKTGLNDLDCDKEYDKCTLTKGTLNTIVNKLIKKINGDGDFSSA